jgi:hypothetical protein
MRVKKDEILKVLLHQIGDNRICPKCGCSFIPADLTTKEALDLYSKLKKGLFR